MNLQTIRVAAIAALTATVLTGCVDDNYDLSDIDTTAGLKVNDLVIPVNIDAVTLESVINLKEGESVKIVDEEYAVVETGDFSSDPINIAAIDMSAPTINSSSHDCVMIPGEYAFDIKSNTSTFSYSTSEVNDHIVSIDEIGTHWTLTLTLRIRELFGQTPGTVTGTVEDLTFLFPKGLTLAGDQNAYDPATGIYKAGRHDFVNGELNLTVEATSVNASMAGIKYDYPTHTATLDGHCALQGGVLRLSNPGGLTALHIDASYAMSRITATSFTGEIQYDIDGCDFSTTDLSSLPDFLAQEGTDIRLANPQIYLSIDDPLNIYSLTASTGLTISAHSDTGLVGEYSLDAPGYFNISTSPDRRNYNFCLSPSKPDKYYVDGETTHVGYSALSNVLSGNGLPKSLSIALDNPRLPRQRVENLQLGTELGSVTGTYTFFAPLALADGSTIAYTGSMDGWSSDDLDAVTISDLTVTALADSDLPVDAELSAYPIDCHGNRIGEVEITGAKLKALAKGEPITLSMHGSIKMLDGIVYTVKVKQADSKALTPDMSIKLDNVRARVSGEYMKEL